MTEELYAFDAEYRARAGVVRGVDEAGPRPVVRPVCVAAVILDPAAPVDGVNDSKAFGKKRGSCCIRRSLKRRFCLQDRDGGASDHRRAEYTERYASGHAAGCGGPWWCVGAGAHRWQPVPEMEIPAQSVVNGDAVRRVFQPPLFWPKVSRDRYMEQLAAEYPQYQLEKHKGYRPSCITRAAGRIRHSAVLPQVLFEKNAVGV